MLRRYTKVLLRQVQPCGACRFVGRIPSLPGCIAVGVSREEVLAALERKGAERLEAIVRSALPVPKPDLPIGFEGLVVDHSEAGEM